MTELLSWQRPGELVALRDDLPSHVLTRARRMAARSGLVDPVVGVVYTIREVLLDPAGTLCVRLVEIVNPEMQFGDAFGEAMFTAAAFRPVDKPSIESLRALLKPTQVEKKRVFEEMIAEAGHV